VRKSTRSGKPWKFPALVLAVFLGAVGRGQRRQRDRHSEVIPASMLYVAVAVVFWQESRRQETLADRLLGVSFASWGVLWVSLHFLNGSPELQGASINVVAPRRCAFVAMLMVMALYEEEKRRIERTCWRFRI